VTYSPLYDRRQKHSFDAYRFFMDIQQKIGIRIRELRNKKELSQEALAHLAEIDRTYMTGVETGKRNISVKILHKIILALDCNYKDFFNDSKFLNGA